VQTVLTGEKMGLVAAMWKQFTIFVAPYATNEITE
jgi:hypothetical protein